MALSCISQKALSATTDTQLVPETEGTAIASAQHLRSLTVCNRDPSAATFRIWLRRQGAATATHQYLYYDNPIVPNDTFTVALDIGLLPGDLLFGRASTANLTFQIFAEPPVLT